MLVLEKRKQEPELDLDSDNHAVKPNAGHPQRIHFEQEETQKGKETQQTASPCLTQRPPACRHSLHQRLETQLSGLRSGCLGIPECIGSNTDYGLSGNWASTRGNSPLVGGLSDRRPPLGGLL